LMMTLWCPFFIPPIESHFFNSAKRLPHLLLGQPYVDYWGYYPTSMGWAKGLELPKQKTFGTTLNHLIHSQVLCQ
jgi:hypothetical protein